MHARTKKMFVAVIVLSLFGILVSAYATYQHYRPAGTSFCNLSDAVSCDIVNKSKYSEIAGIPVAVIGIGGYFFLAFFAGMILAHRIEKIGQIILVLLSLSALIFSLSLTYIEFFWLKALCLLCIASQIIILIISIISIFLWRTSSKSPASL